ncbi:3-dehydroquinate synthase [Spirochaetia bacterium]|nr:3-dehydroquinate synthase [Spirochaetia bacterium]
MENQQLTFHFGAFSSAVHIQGELPRLDAILEDASLGLPSAKAGPVLLVCDKNTEALARGIRLNRDFPLLSLPAGEEAKNWSSVEAILREAKKAGLGRDSLIIGVGGGVITDLAAFAASVYMRGTGLSLVSTTLLGMADAALGGKTGFDFLGLKNFVGTFYPAAHVYMPLEALGSLPPREWKSGMAELIKTALLDDETGTRSLIEEGSAGFTGFNSRFPASNQDRIGKLVCRAVRIKGRIVEADPRETGTGRALLNLGHTFGHALEASAGLGRLSHGEAVAWGIARSCELGLALGITPPERAEFIERTLHSWGYETAVPHPLMGDRELFIRSLGEDKKKRAGSLRFVVPASRGAVLISLDASESGRSYLDTLFSRIRNAPEAAPDRKAV